MLALWILLSVFALIALLSALPLRIFMSYNPDDGFRYRVKYFLIPLADSTKPPKPEKPKKKKKTEPSSEKKPPREKNAKKKNGSGPVSFLLSFLGLDEISTVAKAKQSISENGLPETVGNVFAAVRNLFSRIFGLICKGVFSKFDLQIVVGDADAADAAIRYGSICAGVYPLLTLLDSAIKFRDRNIDIRCDFTQESITAKFVGEFYYRPYSFIAFAGGLIWRYLKQQIKKGGSKA